MHPAAFLRHNMQATRLERAVIPPYPWNQQNHHKNTKTKTQGNRSPRLGQMSVVAMATRVSPQHFAWFHWIGHPRKPPSRPKHLWSICHTSRLIGDFVQLKILGSKFWALGAKNRRTTFCRVPHENWRPKNGSIPSRNTEEESIWSFSVTNRWTDAQTDRVNDKK